MHRGQVKAAAEMPQIPAIAMLSFPFLRILSLFTLIIWKTRFIKLAQFPKFGFDFPFDFFRHSGSPGIEPVEPPCFYTAEIEDRAIH